MNNMSVCLVTVTYGNRVNLLMEVLKTVENEEIVNKIIIVNNGSDLSELNKVNFKKDIQIINLYENTGSANGYYSGLKEAYDTDNDFIMIIDDDNIPEIGSIQNLANYYKVIKVEKNIENIALIALREDRLDFKRMAFGHNINDAFSLGNSFLGWDIRKIPLKILYKLIGNGDRLKPNSKIVEYTKVPIAPYGGLFFHKSLLEIIGFPNPQFYLYCDDYDFTYRINKASGEIYLVPSSKVIDIDKSWFVKEKHGFIMSFLTSKSSFRVYYGIRNRVYFETRNLVSNKLIYLLNKSSFFIILFMMSIFLNKKDRFKMIIKAVSNGKKGILGKESSIS